MDQSTRKTAGSEGVTLGCFEAHEDCAACRKGLGRMEREAATHVLDPLADIREVTARPQYHHLQRFNEWKAKWKAQNQVPTDRAACDNNV